LLLTATRRNEASEMAWDELAGDDWIIPATRMKGALEHVIPLSPAARAILESIPRIGPSVFTTDGRTAIGGFGRGRTSCPRRLELPPGACTI